MSKFQSKKIKAIIFIILGISSPILFSITFQRGSSTQSDTLFNPNSSITYELNYTIDYQSYYRYPTIFKIWVARIENWSADQSSEIIFQINPDNIVNHTLDEFDIYNNSYDYFYKEMEGISGDQSFNLQYQYEITSAGIKYEIPDNLTLDNYDISSNLYQYYTSYQPYCETNDTGIINTSLSLTDGLSSLNDMIEAIYLYVVENLQYVAMTDSIGAAASLSTKAGDCSEFSSLMVALLRTVGIPARKVLGISLVDEDPSSQTPKYDLEVGDVWSYSTDEDNIPGHAWVQYYIPEIGWVSADPTWGNSLYQTGQLDVLQYLNQMDYLHLITTIGDYYGSGIEPPLDLLDSDEEGMPEFPFFYPIGNSTNYEFNFSLDFKIIEVNISEDAPRENPDWATILLLAIGGGSFLIFALIAVAVIKKSNSNKKAYYNYR